MLKKSISFFIILVMMLTTFSISVPSAGSKAFADTDIAVDSTVTIYAIYMKRASGSASASDRYGDAVLIQSDGKFLLMDTGAKAPLANSSKVYVSELVHTLKKIGVNELDVYISHLHKDHFGGLEAVCRNFKVNTLYMPDLNLCKDYETPTISKSINAIYYEQAAKALKGLNGKNTRIVNLVPDVEGKRLHYDYDIDLQNSELQYLSDTIQFVGSESTGASSVQVGSVSGRVIGPVGNYTVNQFASQDGIDGTMEGHYLNNTSLVTMFDFGKVKFLTCGDIEKIEESKLASKYGTNLGANIMKVSNHGIPTSSSNTFVSKVAPIWSVNCDHGFTDKTTGRSTHSRYGYYYGVASSKHTLIIKVDGSSVRLYKDINNNGKIDDAPLKGWVASSGRYQYYSSSGLLQKGWTQVGSSKYYLAGKSGFRYTGSHKISGVTCKFSSSGILTSPAKPTKVKIRNLSSTSTKVKIRWRKASRVSRYEIYRASSSSGKYTKIATVKSTARSYTTAKPVKGKRYYFKVRAIRYTAGTTLYGSFSAAKRSR